MFNLGSTEILIILAVALLLLGPQQLPEIGKQIGKMLREFRNMSGDVQRALDLDGHHDYDTSYQNRIDYGYTDKNQIVAVDPYNEPDAAKTFAYSAPTQGTTVAAIGAKDLLADDFVSEEPATHTASPTGSVEAPTHARVYNEPEVSATETATAPTTQEVKA